jgi:hypothetical protein
MAAVTAQYNHVRKAETLHSLFESANEGAANNQACMFMVRLLLLSCAASAIPTLSFVPQQLKKCLAACVPRAGHP